MIMDPRLPFVARGWERLFQVRSMLMAAKKAKKTTKRLKKATKLEATKPLITSHATGGGSQGNPS
jgi:hypothetical protein